MIRLRDLLLPQAYAYGAGFLLLTATNAFSLMLPWIIKLAVDNIQTYQDVRFLHDAARAVFWVAIGYGLLRVFSRVVIFGAGRDVEGKVREILYNHLQTLDQTFSDLTPQGEVVSLLTNDTNVIRLMFGMGILNFLNGFILYTLTFVLMVSLNIKLALFALLPYLIMIILFAKLAPAFHRKSRIVQDEIARLTDFVQENISGQEVIRAFHKGPVQEARFQGLGECYQQANIDLARTRGLLFTSTSAISGMGVLLLLWIGGEQVISQRIGLGDFIAFLGYLSLLIMPTLMFGFVISVWQRGQASFERIQLFLRKKPIIQDPPAAITIPLAKRKEAWSITLQQLTFRYPGSERPEKGFAVRDVTLQIPAGKITALVGPVGSGKSTLFKLLTRLYPIGKDMILLNGRDLIDFSLDSVRSLLGVMPQEIFLFSRSLANNIAFGVAKETPPGEVMREVETCADQAQLHLREAEMSLTLHTRVGERGILLSGGQRQRISVARALASQAPILLFDEPFSSLDYKTAFRIMQNLYALRQEARTILLITHKISLLKDVDQIAVVQDGTVVATGKHDDLVRRSDVYRALVTKERLEYEHVAAA